MTKLIKKTFLIEKSYYDDISNTIKTKSLKVHILPFVNIWEIENPEILKTNTMEQLQLSIECLQEAKDLIMQELNLDDVPITPDDKPMKIKQANPSC